MKISLEDNRRFMLRFDKGEDVIKGLADFMVSRNFQSGVFQGIGSCTEVELGYFNKNLKEYRKKPFYEDMEIVSVAGNISLFEGKPLVHCHGVFGRTDFTTIGGHVFRLITLATCEIFLIHMEGTLERLNNADFNLSLLA
jgi:predicted DNA-binding protein with PD1-like motif